MTLALLALLQLSVHSPAIAVSVTGWVEVESEGTRRTLSRFDRIEEGSQVITHDDATAQLRLASGSLLRLGPKTQLTLQELNHQDPAGMRKESMRLMVGRVWARVTNLFGSNSKFEVSTPTAVAGVRGTSFVAEAEGEEERFVLLEGAIELLQQQASLRLDEPGAFVTARASGLGSPGVLDAASLQNLIKDVGGAGAVVVNTLQVRHKILTQSGGQGSSSNSRKNARGDILGPQGLVDAPVTTNTSNSIPGGGGGPATVEIRIDLPESRGDGPSSVSPQGPDDM